MFAEDGLRAGSPVAVRLRGCAALAAATLAASAVVACGSSSGSKSTTAGGAGGGSADASAQCNRDAARKELAAHRGVPTFIAPGPPVDAAKLRGKTVFVIPASSAIPFNAAIDRAMVDAGRRIGLRVTVYPSQAQPSQWVQGMNQAIASHADAIALVAADPKLLGPQIAAARRAGIPVISSALYDVTDPDLAKPHRAPNLAAVVDSPFSLAARLEVDQAIVERNCEANIAAVQSAEFENFKYMVDGARDAVKRNCARCRLKLLNVSAADWASKLQPNLQTALVSDPKINWAIPFVDPMTQYAVPAVLGTNRIGKVRMSTFNGSPFALKFVKQGQVVRMDVAENLDWKGWANLDQTMRVMLGMTPVKSERTPVRIFDQNNIGEAGNPPTYNTGLGSAYVDGYLKLWGVR